MLDLRTILLVVVFIAAMQSVVWLFVWLTWRRLYELKLIAAASVCFMVGVLFFVLRGPAPEAWQIVAANSIVKLGLLLMADGLARFLGQPRYPWLGALLLVSQVAFWSGAMAWAPETLWLRVNASTLFTLAVMGFMCLTLARDRSQPRLLRWVTVAVLGVHMGANVALSLLETLNPAAPAAAALGAEAGAPVLGARNAWFFFESLLFLIAFFACLLFMVSARLSADLRARNRALAAEVAERRRLEDELSASLATERRLREEQRQFMRMVGHEFRTPLATIQLEGEMIGMNPDEPEATTARRLAGIAGSVRRMAGLIDRFLAAEREDGESLRAEPLEVAALLAEVERHFAALGHGDRLRFAPAAGAGRYRGDSGMLQTVLINLIDNALKYSPADRPVDVIAGLGDGALEFQVVDRGIGIPEGERAAVGRRFFRASNAAGETGTGTGLYNSQRLLDYHGGTLRLGPGEAGGTVVLVRLPLPGPPPIPAQAPTRAAPPAPSDRAPEAPAGARPDA